MIKKTEDENNQFSTVSVNFSQNKHSESANLHYYTCKSSYPFIYNLGFCLFAVRSFEETFLRIYNRTATRRICADRFEIILSYKYSDACACIFKMYDYKKSTKKDQQSVKNNSVFSNVMLLCSIKKHSPGHFCLSLENFTGISREIALV
jgi:hypothetical protein